jgi:GNAT superfamily N-acetyltransferase
MIGSNPVLPTGYSPVPPGHIANVATCLEMTAPPPARPGHALAPPLRLERMERPDLVRYRALYRAVGADLMWFSRLVMADDVLAAILGDPAVEVFVLGDGAADLGLLELDFRTEGECELAFFGLAPGAIGQGLGRALMEAALARAWARPIRRLWVHTCTFDHPSALAFYVRSGFRPFAVTVEVAPDPRLTGHLPRDAAPQVPLIEPAAL